jgi:hypothetical protein
MRLEDAAMDEFVRVFSLDEVVPGTGRVATFEVSVRDGEIYVASTPRPLVPGRQRT